MSACTGKYDCRLCDKPFSSRNAFARHEVSVKHQQAVIDAETLEQQNFRHGALDAVQTHPRTHATLSSSRQSRPTLGAAPQQPTNPLSADLGSRLNEEDTSGISDSPDFEESGAHAAEPVAPVRPHKASRLAYQHSSAHLPVTVCPRLWRLCCPCCVTCQLQIASSCSKCCTTPRFLSRTSPGSLLMSYTPSSTTAK